uniref:Uncharacterized protein n=1 Tax=viral metagenome TaxID=1070528 RepID=A0A6C0HA48_9ZZZZ
MSKSKNNSLLKYLYYITLFTLAYFLLFFIWNKYNEYRKIENFTGGLPIMSSNKTGNIFAWVGVILAGCLIIGIFHYFIKETNKKNRINKAASNLYKELSKTWSD